MKLKTFNPRNTIVGGKNILPSISFCAKNGMIKLSAGFVKERGFEAGMTVSLAQDEEKPENWYLRKDDQGFELRMSGSGSKRVKNPSLCFSSKDIASKVIRSSALPNSLANTVTMNLDTDPITIEGVEYFEIATKTAK
ncbi:MAG: hypothetical protein ABJG41_09940 [Cyclobacteriaceae bacterium]